MSRLNQEADKLIKIKFYQSVIDLVTFEKLELYRVRLSAEGQSSPLISAIKYKLHYCHVKLALQRFQRDPESKTIDKTKYLVNELEHLHQEPQSLARNNLIRMVYLALIPEANEQLVPCGKSMREPNQGDKSDEKKQVTFALQNFVREFSEDTNPENSLADMVLITNQKETNADAALSDTDRLQAQLEKAGFVGQEFNTDLTPLGSSDGLNIRIELSPELYFQQAIKYQQEINIQASEISREEQEIYKSKQLIIQAFLNLAKTIAESNYVKASKAVDVKIKSVHGIEKLRYVNGSDNSKKLLEDIQLAFDEVQEAEETDGEEKSASYKDAEKKVNEALKVSQSIKDLHRAKIAADIEIEARIAYGKLLLRMLPNDKSWDLYLRTELKAHLEASLRRHSVMRKIDGMVKKLVSSLWQFYEALVEEIFGNFKVEKYFLVVTQAKNFRALTDKLFDTGPYDSYDKAFKHLPGLVELREAVKLLEAYANCLMGVYRLKRPERDIDDDRSDEDEARDYFQEAATVLSKVKIFNDSPAQKNLKNCIKQHLKSIDHEYPETQSENEIPGDFSEAEFDKLISDTTSAVDRLEQQIRAAIENDSIKDAVSEVLDRLVDMVALSLLPDTQLPKKNGNPAKETDDNQKVFSPAKKNLVTEIKGHLESLEANLISSVERTPVSTPERKSIFSSSFSPKRHSPTRSSERLRASFGFSNQNKIPWSLAIPSAAFGNKAPGYSVLSYTPNKLVK